MSHFRLALVLALTVAIGPFAIDAYLPAFPSMAVDLNVAVHEVSLSISVYIMALAVGTLIGGPLADRYGRQPVMLGGLAIFTVASLFLWQVESLRGLLILRAVQAFGGGWATACVPALVRDRVQGAEAAKLFSLIGLIMVAAPAIAPSLGSLILHWSGWNTVFLFLALYSFTVMVIVKSVLFSKQSELLYETDRIPPLQRYLAVLRTTPALRFIFVQAATFSVMMVFVTHSSFVYQAHFGVSTSLFGILFGANIVMMAMMNMLNRRLVNYFRPLSIMQACLAIQAVSVSLLVAVAYWQLPMWLFVAGIMVTVGMFGGIGPNAQASYMDYFHKNGGTAAALMGAIQFSTAGAIAALSALLPEKLIAVVLTQAVCSILGLLCACWPGQQPAAKAESGAIS